MAECIQVPLSRSIEGDHGMNSIWLFEKGTAESIQLGVTE